MADKEAALAQRLISSLGASTEYVARKKKADKELADAERLLDEEKKTLTKALQDESQKNASQKAELGAKLLSLRAHESELAQRKTKIEAEMSEATKDSKAPMTPEVILATMEIELSKSALVSVFSDANGEFALSLPNGETFVVVAMANRSVVGNEEKYFWGLTVKPEKRGHQKLLLANHNHLSNEKSFLRALGVSLPDDN